MIEKMEKRFISSEKLEIRADEDGTERIEGYAAVFDRDSVDLGGFIEQIRPGAFTRTLRENVDVKALMDHDTSMVVGRTTSGTLELSEDKTGLRISVLPPNSPRGEDLKELVRRGDVDGMSFGFVTRQDEWTFSDDEEPDRRALLDVDLLEVTFTAWPAYPDTSAAVRSKNDAILKRAKEEKTHRSTKAKLNLEQMRGPFEV